MRRFFLMAVVGLLTGYLAHAQNISNTRLEQKGNTLVVFYNLQGLGLDRVAQVYLYISSDGGRSYKGPLKAVSGDVGRMDTDEAKSIVWHVFDKYSSLKGDIVFEVRAQLQNRPISQEFFLAYNVSGSSAFGLTVGSVGRWGWYARLKSNGSFVSADYTVKNARISDYDGEGYYVFTNQVKRSRVAATAGIMHRLNKFTYLYGGGGYGSRLLLWNAEEFSYATHKKTGDIWATHVDRSASGAEIEAGLMLRFGKLNLSAGINAVGFGFFEINGGVGFFL